MTATQELLAMLRTYFDMGTLDDESDLYKLMLRAERESALREKIQQWLKLAERERDGGKYIIDWPGTFANALKEWPVEPKAPLCPDCTPESCLCADRQERAMQALADQAQELDMGYGQPKPGDRVTVTGLPVTLRKSAPPEPTCEHDWTTDTCPKCGAKRERGPLPSCGWGPCGILEGVEYHDPHCPSLKEKKRAQNRRGE